MAVDSTGHRIARGLSLSGCYRDTGLHWILLISNARFFEAPVRASSLDSRIHRGQSDLRSDSRSIPYYRFKPASRKFFETLPLHRALGPVCEQFARDFGQIWASASTTHAKAVKMQRKHVQPTTCTPAVFNEIRAQPRSCHAASDQAPEPGELDAVRAKLPTLKCKFSRSGLTARTAKC